jgi:hypothetical protein
MSAQPLFTPVRMGDLDLPNRIVMAPLTRMRAGSIDHVPTALQAEYYAQRASAGLIVAEATAISPDGFGYADTPRIMGTSLIGAHPFPITSCGEVEDNLPDCAAYLSHGWVARAAPTRGLTVHTEDVVFASSGGELPSHLVGGHIILGGI